MKWNIKYYNEAIEEAVLALPDSLLARYAHLTEIMKDYGPNLGMPHIKAMGKGLFELRLKGKKGLQECFIAQ